MQVIGILTTLVAQDYRRMVVSRAFALGVVLMLLVSACLFFALDFHMLSDGAALVIQRSGAFFQEDSGIYTYHLPPIVLCFIAMRRLQPFWLVVPMLAARVVAFDEASGYGEMRAIRSASFGIRLAAATIVGGLLGVTAFALVLGPVFALCQLVSCGVDSAEYFSSISRALAEGMPDGSDSVLYGGSAWYVFSIAGVMCAVAVIGAFSSVLAFIFQSAAPPTCVGVLFAIAPYLPFYSLNELLSRALASAGASSEVAYTVDVYLFGSGFPVSGIYGPSSSMWVSSMAWMLVETLLLVLLACAAVRIRERR